jgi:outer membrane receptor protein involved in Fe transport
LALTFGTWVALSGLAQTASTVPPGPPARAETRQSSDTAPVTLSAFEVREDSDTSYGALNSNSVTRFNSELARLPISADVFTETFMNDIGVRTIEEMMLFIGGAGFAYDEANATVGNTQQGDRNPGGLKLRGLSASTMRRDAFLPGTTVATGVTSSFDVERVETITGPQSLLYGNGGAGGVINTVSKQARFNRPRSTTLTLRADHYANGMAQLDFSQGGRGFASRIALTHERMGGRRSDIYGDMQAVYAQFALRYGATVLRLTGRFSDYSRRVASTAIVYTGRSATDDVRSGQFLPYLLATNQLERAADGGASGGGFIGNGKINWETVNSYDGDMKYEKTVAHFGTLSLESRLTSWLSAEVAVGLSDYENTLRNSAGPTLLAPNAATNPFGDWAMMQVTALNDRQTHSPSRLKTMRAALFADNRFFNRRWHSQTIFGADYDHTASGTVDHYYYQADASGNIIVNPALAGNTDYGRTVLGTPTRLAWPVGGGPLKYPLWKPFSSRVSYNGVTWVRALGNFSDPAQVSANNPLGLRLGGRSYSIGRTTNRGFFGANTSTLWGDRLDLLAGFRWAEVDRVTFDPGLATPINGSNRASARLKEDSLSSSLGASLKLTRWLRAYVNFSDSYNLPNSQNDPYGNLPETAHGIGEEYGVKVANAQGTISGTLAYYRVNSKNEQFRTTSQLQSIINPAGLNGAHLDPGVWINVDRKSEGLQLTATASPSRNWRMRLSAAEVNGTVGTSKSYLQLYNDQFYANSAGQVTYRNGTVVYVNPAFNRNQPTVSATAPGAIPLTIAMMNDRTSPYYANPVANTGAILASSNVGLVLRTVDPVAGPILTGVTGLPITAQQINPGFTVPGTIPVATAGEETIGYPKYSAMFTNIYTFATGWLKGCRLGGTVSRTWQNRGYYFYPQGVTPGAIRLVYFRPNLTQVNLITGYSWQWGRYPLSAQLNVNNLFNRYNVLILPNPTLGYRGPNMATLDTQPRAYVLTGSVKF